MLESRARRGEAGFTLIELMVVVLIIAILIAIAVPTFLGARQRAQDRAAQSLLRQALTAAKVYYTDNQSYTQNTAALSAIEPVVVFQAHTNPNTSRAVAREVSVWSDRPHLTLFITQSASGDTLCLLSLEKSEGSSPAGVYYKRGYWDGWSDPMGGAWGWKTNGW